MGGGLDWKRIAAQSAKKQNEKEERERGEKMKNAWRELAPYKTKKPVPQPRQEVESETETTPSQVASVPGPSHADTPTEDYMDQAFHLLGTQRVFWNLEGSNSCFADSGIRHNYT